VGGLFDPKVYAILGGVYLLSRIIYALGYASGSFMIMMMMFVCIVCVVLAFPNGLMSGVF